MKNIAILVSLFIVIQSYSQSEIKFGIGASNIIDFNFQQVYEYKKSYTSVNSYFPFKVGVDLHFDISQNHSIVTGYNLLYRYMEVNLYTTTIGDHFYGYKMFTSEIPILYRYSWALKSDNFSMFCELGGSFDFMYARESVFGGYKEVLNYIVVAKWRYFYTMNLPSGFTPSIQGGLGFNNKIGKKGGTIQVSVNYHYQVPKKISNELYYYYEDGLGTIATEESNFFTRSTYLGFNLKYYLPFSIKLKNCEKTKKK